MFHPTNVADRRSSALLLLQNEPQARTLERVRNPRVHVPSVHAERRVDRIRGDAVVDLRGQGAVGVAVEVAVGEAVEEVLGADGEDVAVPAIRDLRVGQPFGGVDLVVGGEDGEAAVVAVAALAERRAPAVAGPVLHQADVVVRLSAFDAAALDAVEEHVAESCQLRRRGHVADDLRLVVAVRGGEIEASAHERVLIVRDEVVAVRARVDRVREEARRGGAERLDQLQDRRAGEVAGEDDAVVDVDVEVVGGEFEIRHRLPDHAAR